MTDDGNIGDDLGMGLMLGSEMVWRRIRSYGKQIGVITLATASAPHSPSSRNTRRTARLPKRRYRWR